MGTIRILIVDDNADFRRRIRQLLTLESDIEIIGEAADGREAVRKAGQLKPDLVLIDVRMPGMNGLDATQVLRRDMPATQVIVLTAHDLQVYREAATASGASRCVVKRCLVETLLPAIREVYREREPHRSAGT